MNRNNRDGNSDDLGSGEDIIVRELYIPQLFLVEEKDGVLGVLSQIAVP